MQRAYLGLIEAMTNAIQDSFTIGAGAGFAGDRIEPAVQMARSGEVDAIALECLAERTLVNAIRMREANPPTPATIRGSSGASARCCRMSRPRCRVITNLGAANPAAAGARRHGSPKRSASAACASPPSSGDDVTDRVDEVEWTQSPEGGQWIGAHVYLGLEPMVAALHDGADVVITGRVADSSLVAAAPVQALGLPAGLARAALTVGHLLECSGQLSGGNLAEPGIADLPAEALARIGYPIADIGADGSATIRLLDGQPGRLNVASCTLQLLYEVHDPRAYITPDAVLDFTGIAFEETGANRVRLSGARGAAKPDRLKVIGFLARRGLIADVEIAYAGTGALGRARLAADMLRSRLPTRARYWPIFWSTWSASIRCSARARCRCGASRPSFACTCRHGCEDAELAQAVEDEVYTLTISGPAGGGSVRSERRGRVESITGFLPRDRVFPRIEWAHAS